MARVTSFNGYSSIHPPSKAVDFRFLVGYEQCTAFSVLDLFLALVFPDSPPTGKCSSPSNVVRATCSDLSGLCNSFRSTIHDISSRWTKESQYRSSSPSFWDTFPSRTAAASDARVAGSGSRR